MTTVMILLLLTYRTHLAQRTFSKHKISSGYLTVTMDSTPKHPVSKNQVRKPNFSKSKTPLRTPSLTGNGIVSVHDPHSGGVGHGWHA